MRTAAIEVHSIFCRQDPLCSDKVHVLLPPKRRSRILCAFPPGPARRAQQVCGPARAKKAVPRARPGTGLGAAKGSGPAESLSRRAAGRDEQRAPKKPTGPIAAAGPRYRDIPLPKAARGSGRASISPRRILRPTSALCPVQPKRLSVPPGGSAFKRPNSSLSASRKIPRRSLPHSRSPLFSRSPGNRRRYRSPRF